MRLLCGLPCPACPVLRTCTRVVHMWAERSFGFDSCDLTRLGIHLTRALLRSAQCRAVHDCCARASALTAAHVGIATVAAVTTDSAFARPLSMHTLHCATAGTQVQRLLAATSYTLMTNLNKLFTFVMVQVSSSHCCASTNDCAAGSARAPLH